MSAPLGNSGTPAQPKAPGETIELDPESPGTGKRPGPWPPRMDPLPADHSHNPRALGSWARRTGYKSNLSGESVSTTSDVEIGMSDGSLNGSSLPRQSQHGDQLPTNKDLENGLHANGHKDLKLPPGLLSSTNAGTAPPAGTFIIPQRKPGSDTESASNVQNYSGPQQFRMDPVRAYKDSEVDMMSQSQDPDGVLMPKHSHMKYEIRETPGYVPLILYGIQHYFSIVGSLILIPHIIVRAAGGSDEQVAKLISTMLLVSGISTLLHSFFGSRLPLIQGASFVYLAPALTIVFLPKNFTADPQKRFEHTMRDLQGAVIISSVFQLVVGYSGLMAILLRAINPVVVAPTVAAVGLAFFGYGFPYVGTCVEIGIPQILVVLVFALYLRRVSIFGHKVFQVYAVPLGLAIIWAYAFLLTETGRYDYKGCSVDMAVTSGIDMPVNSTIVPSNCTDHVFTMGHCRTDVSNALSKSSWFRFPYPFQWGTPSFDWKTGFIMIAASIIATVDSVGSYHATALLVASRAPTPGVVSRGIAMEGLTSAIAGLWGTGTGATTLTENVHTIAVTKMGSRRAVEFGAVVLIILSIIGKVGGFLATIPRVVVAALLVVMWTMLAALGLSNLRYSETGSSRNVLIVGLSLFLSLSVPAYFQQYDTGRSNTSVQPYFQQFTVSQRGPVHTSSSGVNEVLNTILSLHMVIAFLAAFILDNTVPGSRQERGTFIWTKKGAARNELAVVKDYGLPLGSGRFFGWVKLIGL